MIGISTTTQNTSGAVIIKEAVGSELDRYPVRVSRSATLDGEAKIVHSGFSHGDRTLRISAEVTEATATILKTLAQTETLITVSLFDGCFAGAIEDLTVNNGMIDMTILIESELS